MAKIIVHRVLRGILFAFVFISIMTAISACGNPDSLNVIQKKEDEISLEINNTKRISIYDIVSSDSNNNTHFTDPAIIKQIEDLFNKTSFLKCEDNSIQGYSLFITFSNDTFSSDSNSLHFFVYANDIVDIDGIKYKSRDSIFDAINDFYLQKKISPPR
ncbi:hypothetical protein [Desulfitobacterium hafniense]|uniref:Prokaryotic membrane lipoprotein lipid attachment site profile n=5 Tax=root TaxID=1 RepID=Q24UZ3_DESHY|nr:hypothetical protein [Desulfitobacterium hafniense]ACL21518.1 hypothetical protein Dhaf_3500 [Desulfitobacterium hafniense DCB-2]EHL07576.1 hypothetical protein HMPREF0322_01693 [Desulfitobacterium hafniense DP7]KTE89810.1 hypothetical protein AT727_10715 [Desulfitobacterium hafniense]MEA5023208.1 hypothetical protein [Desulfitobacterium hafniense]CDX02438.1 Hypothetical protein DPCES_2551 [Desulfitobacterium hafniense]